MNSIQIRKQLVGMLDVWVTVMPHALYSAVILVQVDVLEIVMKTRETIKLVKALVVHLVAL